MSISQLTNRAARTLRVALGTVTVAAGLTVGAGDAAAQLLNRSALITTTDYENGSLRSEVLLPCNQAYVEIFQKKNGVQVTAKNITASAQVVNNGYCIYSHVSSGFTPFDLVETRFYSYLPASPGVFTPGPAEQVWTRYNYGMNPIGAQPGDVQPGDLLIADLGNGEARFDMYAPSGQAYVEVFARQNGIQNVAGAITGTETPIGNGISRYSRTKAGYSAGNLIDFRAYNFLPNTAGVFAPGPSPHSWNAYTYAQQPGEFFHTKDISYDLKPKPGSDVEVYFGHATSNIIRAHTGWYLDRGVTPMLTVPAKGLTRALMSRVYVRKCDTGEWIPVSDIPALNFTTTSELGMDGLYQFTPGPVNSQLPGTRVDPTFECGGHPITIPTLIGPQTLTTSAKIHYAYVVHHFNFRR